MLFMVAIKNICIDLLSILDILHVETGVCSN